MSRFVSDTASLHLTKGAVREMSTRPKRKPAAEQQVRLTPSDDALLDLVIRYHAVTVPLMLNTVRYGKNRSGVYRQLARLVRTGLLEDLATGPSNVGRPRDVFALYVPTAQAYAYRGSDLRPTPVALSQVRHTLAVAQVGLNAERQDFQVVTDREIRRQIQMWRARRPVSTPPDAPWVGSDERSGSRPALPQGSGAPRTHAPDLVILRNGLPVTAIEVELTAKNDQRFLSLLRMYGRSEKFANLIYYVPDGKTERRLVRLAESLPASEQPRSLVVRRYLPRHSQS